MKVWLPRLIFLLLPLLASSSSLASPLDFNLGQFGSPQIVGAPKPIACTVTFLIEDYVANETYAVRMKFLPDPEAVPVNGRIPCPALVPPRVAEAALDGCRNHATNRADCVFADMKRGFSSAPDLGNTSDASSRCQSDQASEIAIACADAGKLDTCSVACGNGALAAVLSARDRCETTHQKICRITGAVPVEAP